MVFRWPVRITWLALVLIFSGWGWPVQAQEQELSLDQVVEIAVQRNPGIKASQQQVEGARARITQTTSAYWPQVTGFAVYDRQRLDGGTGSTPVPGGFTNSFNNYNVNLSASQYIYDFGQTSGLVGESRQNLHASREGLTTTLADVVQQVKNAYFEILKNERLVQVGEETLSSREKHLKQAKAFYEVGLRPRIDVTRAELDVANARQGLIVARYNVRLSLVNLENIMGGPPVKGPYRVVDVRERPPRPPALEPLIDEALKARSEVAQLDALIKAAESRLESSKGKYWPSFSGLATYGWQNTEFPLGENWEVGVQLNWPIFSGFQTQGEVAEVRARIRQTRAQLEQTRLQVIQQVSQAYLRLGETEESIAAAEVAVHQAQENLDLAEGRYRTGVGDAIENTDAQVTLTTEKARLVQANYSYLQGLADLERALGRGPRPEGTSADKDGSR
jgi:outer membrane protein